MTMQQLKLKVEMLNAVSKRLGIIKDDEESHIDEGSKVNGRAFRLWLLEEGSTAHHSHPCCPSSMGYLGMTKKEAGEAIGFILDGLFAAEGVLTQI